jgi:hypothetical protein
MKENFDDIIRRRWEEQHFPVDDAHRQEMERLLEGDKRRRGFMFWWIGGLAVTMLIGYGVWRYNAPQADVKSRTENTETAAKELANNETPNVPLSAGAEATQRRSQGAGGREAKEIASTHVANEKDNQSSFSNSDQSISKIKIPHKENLNHKSTSHRLPRVKSTANTEQILHKNEKPIYPLSAGAEATQRTSQGARGELSTPKGELPNDKIPVEGYKVELENPNQVSILSKEAAIQVFPDSIEYDPWTNAIYHNGTVRSLNKTMPLDALAIQEVESIKKNAPGAITPHTKMTHPVYYIAETGLGFVLASQPNYDGGIKFNVGGGLGMKLIPRVHLQLTGGYLMQDGGFHFERTSTVNTLSFGVRSQFNSLQPDRLHFVYAKLGAAYRFQRSTLDVHMGVQWLYGAQGNITIQQQSQFPPVTPEVTQYAWLSTQGLRKTQWWSDVSYGYMLLPKLYLHGGVTFYYTSLTESNVPQDGYDWNGKTASVQPFITLNYLLHANF